MKTSKFVAWVLLLIVSVAHARKILDTDTTVKVRADTIVERINDAIDEEISTIESLSDIRDTVESEVYAYMSQNFTAVEERQEYKAAVLMDIDDVDEILNLNY